LPVSALAQGDKKAAYAVLIDNTGSLRTQFPQVNAFSKEIVTRIYQRGPVSIFNFKTQGKTAIVTPGVAWSEDINTLDNYIDTLFVQPGLTTLRDAIYSMAESLNTKVSPDSKAFSEKVIFLITDGEDRSSKIAQNQLLKKLEETGVTVYAVGLVQELDRDSIIRKNHRSDAEKFLKTITSATGGRVEFPNSGERNAARVIDALFKK